MRKWEAQIMYNYVTRQHRNRYWYERFGFKFYYYYLKIRELLKGKTSIPNFVYETNTPCTLRCKECHSYMPFYSKDMHFTTNFETFKTEMDKLLKSVDLIISFRLQGGETLLVKDLPKIVEYICNKKQVQHVQIITNGTVIPSQELLNAMKNPKLFLSMSDYSNNSELEGKLKYNEIIKLCNQNNVHCKYWINDYDDFWFARPQIDEKRHYDANIALQNRKACYCHCHPKSTYFSQGIIYTCPILVYFKAIKPNLSIPVDEYVDIINTPQKILAQKISAFENKKIFLICSKCNALEIVDEKYEPGVQFDNTPSQNF